MNQTSEFPQRNFDIVANDGTALRRGYLEIIFDRYYGDELTEEQQAHPAFLVQLLRRVGREDIPVGFRVFATTLPVTIAPEVKRAILKRVADKLTDDLQINAFSDDVERWNDEWLRFAEYAREANLSWFTA